MSSRLQRLTLTAEQCGQLNFFLTAEQKHYLTRVLRLGAGSQFIALDGQGHWFLAVLQADFATAAILQPLENQRELPIALTLGIAMPKGSGIESVIKQAAELGVTQIVPLWSDRTVIKAGIEVGKAKLERWQRIAQEAAELSLRSRIPHILPPQTFTEFVTQTPAPQRYLCSTRPNLPHLLPQLQMQQRQARHAQDQDLVIAIGCEGGWTEREESQAQDANFTAVSLGDRTLSAITAPIVALSIIAAVLDTP